MGWTDFLNPLASVGSGLLNFFGTQDTNEANAQQAQQQMDFQERMSSTAHQREVADLKAAGLNPMLSVSSGGASSPSGAAATMDNPIKNAVSSAQMQKQLDASIENLKADSRNKETAADLNVDKSWTERATQDSLTQDVIAKAITNNISTSAQSYDIERRKNDAASSKLDMQKKSLDTQLALATIANRVAESRANSAVAAAAVPAARNQAEFQDKLRQLPTIRFLNEFTKDMLGHAHSASSLVR